jgi:hypothetical protein
MSCFRGGKTQEGKALSRANKLFIKKTKNSE